MFKKFLATCLIGIGAISFNSSPVEAVVYNCSTFQNNSAEYGSARCNITYVPWTHNQYRAVLHCKVRHWDYITWHIEITYGNWVSQSQGLSANWCNKGDIVDVTVQTR